MTLIFKVCHIITIRNNSRGILNLNQSTITNSYKRLNLITIRNNSVRSNIKVYSLFRECSSIPSHLFLFLNNEINVTRGINRVYVLRIKLNLYSTSTISCGSKLKGEEIIQMSVSSKVHCKRLSKLEQQFSLTHTSSSMSCTILSKNTILCNSLIIVYKNVYNVVLACNRVSNQFQNCFLQRSTFTCNFLNFGLTFNNKITNNELTVRIYILQLYILLTIQFNITALNNLQITRSSHCLAARLKSLYIKQVSNLSSVHFIKCI